MYSYRIWSFILTMLLAFSLHAQDSGKTIKLEIENFEVDSVLLAYFYGNNQYVSDTAYRSDKGDFVFKTDSFWKTGLYLLVLPPDNRYVQFIISEDEKDMSLKVNAEDLLSRPMIKGSSENKIFWDYLDFLNDSNREVTALRDALESASPLGQEKKSYQDKIDKLDLEVKAYQNELVEEHPESLTAAIVKANMEIALPEFSGDRKEVDRKRYQYYKSHYFDHIDLSDDRLLRSPILFDKVDRYIKKFTVQVPDSIIKSLDEVLALTQGAEENFKFILIHYLNEYAKSKFVGMDGVYVHLVDNYYAAGKAPWVGRKQLDKMLDNANTIRPLLIGKIAPNIQVFKKDLTPVSLHDVEAKYTILIFWAPDCGHCKKAMPDLIDFYTNYKEKGVEIFAVCTKLLEKEASCWEYIEEQELPDWINVTDKYLRSKFGKVYNVKSTPQVYVLGQDKEILTKQVPVEKLGEILDMIIADKENSKDNRSE